MKSLPRYMVFGQIIIFYKEKLYKQEKLAQIFVYDSKYRSVIYEFKFMIISKVSKNS